MNINELKPSHFAQLGVPTCSIWGKYEIEKLAYIYAVCLVRAGDTWQELTPQQCFDLIEDIPEESSERGYMGHVVEGHYQAYWDKVTHQLSGAENAMEIGGLAWNKRNLNRVLNPDPDAEHVEP